MNTSQIIKQAVQSAEHLVHHGVEEVRLPLLLYSDWLEFYGKSDSEASRTSRRLEQKRDWYLKLSLERRGVRTSFALISREALLEGLAEEDMQRLVSEKDKRTALNTLARKGLGKEAPCIHVHPLDILPQKEPVVGTVTIVGEPDEGPECMSAVVHLVDGTPVGVRNVLAFENSPEEAQEMVFVFFDDYDVQEIFTTPGIRRPEFCEDCNELLTRVADPQEVKQRLNL